MKKKIIALALASTAVAPFAFADVTIYGVISSSLESVSATGGSITAPSRARVADDNSRIGFKGSEDLGNGLKSVWQVESSLKYFEQGGTNDAGATATFATRNSFVGLDSAKLGTVLMGQYDSAYKRLTNGGVNVMADTAADIDGTTTNVAAIFSRGESRLANSIHYTTPVWAGFQGGISYGVDETNTPKRNRVSLGGQYNWQGLQIGAGWDHTENAGGYLGYFNGVNATTYSSTSGTYKVGADAGGSVNFAKLVASYKFATGTYIGAGVERGTYDVTTGGSAMSQTGWTLAATQDIGAATLKASYSRLGGLSNTASPDAYKATEWVLGANYNLSKATSVFTYYARINNNALANVDFANTPVYTQSVGTSSAALAAGNRLSVLGLGMKVMF